MKVFSATVVATHIAPFTREAIVWSGLWAEWGEGYPHVPCGDTSGKQERFPVARAFAQEHCPERTITRASIIRVTGSGKLAMVDQRDHSRNGLIHLRYPMLSPSKDLLQYDAHTGLRSLAYGWRRLRQSHASDDAAEVERLIVVKPCTRFRIHSDDPTQIRHFLWTGDKLEVITEEQDRQFISCLQAEYVEGELL